MSSHEQIVNVLALLSPAQALESDVIQASFRDFFNRGSFAECQHLLPSGFKVSLRNPTLRNHTESEVITSDAISQFLKDTGLKPLWVEKLVAAVDTLVTSSDLPPTAYKTLWASKDPTFHLCDTDAFNRLSTLVKGIDQLGIDHSLSACALRLSLLFFSHDVDQIADTVSKEELQSAPGTTRKTIALDTIAQRCTLKRSKLHDLSKRSRNYFLMAEQASIGFLLHMGSVASRWESLPSAVIPWICEYCKKFLASVEKRSRDRDAVAATTIIEGLRAYGWTYLELSESRSRLMKLVGQYVDLNLLRDGQIVLLQSRCSKRPAPGSSECGPQPEGPYGGSERQIEINDGLINGSCQTAYSDHSPEASNLTDAETQMLVEKNRTNSRPTSAILFSSTINLVDQSRLCKRRRVLLSSDERQIACATEAVTAESTSTTREGAWESWQDEDIHSSRARYDKMGSRMGDELWEPRTTGILGELDASMIYRYPELSEVTQQDLEQAEVVHDHACGLAVASNFGPSSANIDGDILGQQRSRTLWGYEEDEESDNELASRFLAESSMRNDQSDQELSMRLQLPQRYQQRADLVPYSHQHTIIDASEEAPHLSKSACNPGPQPPLPILVEVSDTAQSIQFAIEGDIDGLKYLFNQGLASPRDVSHSRQFNLVRWALYGGMHNYKTVQFLLSCGAFVDEESYQHAWDYAFRGKCTSSELFELQCVTLNPPATYSHRDWVEEQQFPLIHNIIIGRSPKLLSAELDDNPDAVYLTDAMGRTALDWATALARLSDMRLLIDRGSPLNTMDVCGRTTVLHAVDSHNDDALRIVLEAGADPNPTMPEGLFRSSPLTAASFGGLMGMVELLIKHGAKVNACNPEGRTALLTVASMQNVACADILLTHGADLGYISSNGRSPLTTAIIHNNHPVLKLFIDRCDTSRWKKPIDRCRLEKLKLLPIIINSADAETMSILTSSDLIKETLADGDGFAAGHEILRSRTDYNAQLGKNFEKLFRCRPRTERQFGIAV